ncbi:hypothetical protein Tco_0153553 [Tanacetum coccineum]
MVPIHRSEDQAVLGSTSLSFALSVSHDRVERIRKNIAEHRSALAGVYVLLVEPLSVQNLTGATGTSDVLPTVVATTIALSTTFASTSTVSSVSVDDYIIADADNEKIVQLNVEEENQGKGEGSVADMVEVEFEKEDASVHLYGPSFWGTSFHHMFRVAPASLLLLLDTPGFKLVLRELSSKLTSRASSFLTTSTSAALSVGMPISAGMIASVPYVNEKGASPLLDLIMVRCAHRT